MARNYSNDNWIDNIEGEIRRYPYASEKWWGETLRDSGVSPGQICKLLKIEVEFDVNKEKCEYDWNCLAGSGWLHADHRGEPCILSRDYRYFYRTGELAAATSRQDPCAAKLAYFEACEMIEKCRVDWWKICKRICNRAGLDCCLMGKYAEVQSRPGSSCNGTLYVDESCTFKLNTFPTSANACIQLAEVMKALLECGWKERC